jgi:hypothetical protein
MLFRVTVDAWHAPTISHFYYFKTLLIRNKQNKLATMTLIFVKDEKMTIKSLCAMIDNAPRMDVFKLEEAVELDGTKGDVIVLSMALHEHPCVEEFNMTSVTLTDATLSLDQVVSMIMDSVPDLRHVKLERVPVAPSALATAESCNSTSLKTPIVPTCALTDKDATQSPSIPLNDIPLSDSPSIPLNDIPLSDTPDNGVSDLGCDAFATAKDKNSVIQTVHLESGGEISSEQRSQVETTSPKRAGGKAHAA